ncbi:MAG: DNA-binding protein [Deltaproteobacteria bacterium]|nr:MAG: DNA-binding protein [Deltaproteobacteria bacterium]PIE72134.1 MAG: DNA-binding protein [Deltaproteobacteria bacterium]
MQRLLSTKEVAEYLNIHEKKVYSLVADKALPATKIAGKWLFPLYLVQQWVENNTINYPDNSRPLTSNQRLIVLAGSNDSLLEQTLSLFNQSFQGHLATFANVGSMGGVHALRNNLCHIASSHLIQDDEADYNFQFAKAEFEKMPVVVNFCKRVQGLLVKKGNPCAIQSIADFKRPGLRMVNRSLATGTRLLLDRELKKEGIDGSTIEGYSHEVARHIDVGMEILSDRADVGMGIEIAAHSLGLDFVPVRWERFDLLISKDVFFEQAVQNLLGLLQSEEFRNRAESLAGYDVSQAGKIMFQETEAT